MLIVEMMSLKSVFLKYATEQFLGMEPETRHIMNPEYL